MCSRTSTACDLVMLRVYQVQIRASLFYPSYPSAKLAIQSLYYHPHLRISEQEPHFHRCSIQLSFDKDCTVLSIFYPSSKFSREADSENMLHDLFRNVLTIPRAIYAGEMINDRPNPFYVNLASTGYRLQSVTFRIPDQYGFFSAGPPRLQVDEASACLLLITIICISAIFSSSLLLLFRIAKKPCSSCIIALFVVSTIIEAGTVWISLCHDPRRGKGHDWGQEKLRRD